MSSKRAILSFFILILTIFNAVNIGLKTCRAQSYDLFLIKEIVEATTDWTTIKWLNGFQVVASTYKITEGEESIQGLEVNGLEAWIAKKGFDTTKVVIEIEAIVKKSPSNPIISIDKGAIEYTDIQLYRYLPKRTYEMFTQVTIKNMGPKQLGIDTSDAFEFSVGTATIENAVPELKGKVFAAYYIWYGNPIGPSGELYHWNNIAEDDIKGAAHYPLLGPYDSQDPNVIRAQIRMAKQAGIDGFLTSWWGPAAFEDRSFQTLLEVAREEDFSILMYYESVRDELTVELISEELDYFLSNYGNHPAYLRDSGKPVIFVYVPSYNNRGEDFWLSVRQNVENNYGPITLIGDHTGRDLFNAFDAFHCYIYLEDDPLGYYNESQILMATGAKTGSDLENIELLKDTGELILVNKPFLVTVYPGFDTQHHKRDPSQYLLVDREEGELYSRNWEVALELDAYSVLITSWNEWHEGTEIEPSREYGFTYLNSTRRFISEYKGDQVDFQPGVIDVQLFPITTSNDDIRESKGVFEISREYTLVSVDIKAEAVVGAKEVSLDIPYITYFENKTQLMFEVLIPCVDNSFNFNVSFSTTSENPVVLLTIEGHSLIGARYIIFNQSIPIITNTEHEFVQEQEPELESTSEAFEGIPGFIIGSVFIGVCVMVAIFWLQRRMRARNIESVTGGVYSINAEYNNHLDENIRVLCNNAFEIPAV